MRKRSLVLLICLALVLLVAVNNTLATTVQGWFNDLTDLLTDGTPTTGDALKVDIVSNSDGVLNPAHYDGVFAWEKAGNAIVRKMTCAKNTAQEAAFVRICIAVKNAPGVLYYRMQVSDTAYKQHIDTTCKIGNESFTLYTFDYKQKLEQGDSTPNIAMDFALDKKTTNEDLTALGGDFVRVQSFAIQADAFVQKDKNGNVVKDSNNQPILMDAVLALKYALGSIESFNPFN